MPKQIERLLILFVILVSLFLLARFLLIPDSFGEYGHYRGLALELNANHPPKYLGEQACVDCHEDIAELKSSDLHGDISCEACHGPGWKHVDDPTPDNIILPSGRSFCGLCHDLNAARPTNAIAQVDLDVHNVENNCIECHNPHAPWQ